MTQKALLKSMPKNYPVLVGGGSAQLVHWTSNWY